MTFVLLLAINLVGCQCCILLLLELLECHLRYEWGGCVRSTMCGHSICLINHSLHFRPINWQIGLSVRLWLGARILTMLIISLFILPFHFLAVSSFGTHIGNTFSDAIWLEGTICIVFHSIAVLIIVACRRDPVILSIYIQVWCIDGRIARTAAHRCSVYSGLSCSIICLTDIFNDLLIRNRLLVRCLIDQICWGIVWHKRLAVISLCLVTGGMSCDGCRSTSFNNRRFIVFNSRSKTNLVYIEMGWAARMFALILDRATALVLLLIKLSSSKHIAACLDFTLGLNWAYTCLLQRLLASDLLTWLWWPFYLR